MLLLSQLNKKTFKKILFFLDPYGHYDMIYG